MKIRAILLISTFFGQKFIKFCGFGQILNLQATKDKFVVEILKIFVAFSEYMIFTTNVKILEVWLVSLCVLNEETYFMKLFQNWFLFLSIPTKIDYQIDELILKMESERKFWKTDIV